jgi:hypothetical protein
MLSSIRTLTYSFSTLDSLLILDVIPIRPILEHASTVLNSITFTVPTSYNAFSGSSSPCQNPFLTLDHVTCEDFLKFLKLHTLHDWKFHIDRLFFISVYSVLKCSPSLLAVNGIWVLPSNLRNSSLFTATCKNSPSAGRVSAANRVCQYSDIFGTPVTSLKQILSWSVTFIYKLMFFRVQIFTPVLFYCFFLAT